MRTKIKPRYSIQNQSTLLNPNTGAPLTGDRIYDGDTVLGEWYDTGNEVFAPKLVEAINEHDKLKKTLNRLLIAAEGFDTLYDDDSRAEAYADELAELSEAKEQARAVLGLLRVPA